jgi:hypothetical protein
LRRREEDESAGLMAEGFEEADEDRGDGGAEWFGDAGAEAIGCRGRDWFEDFSDGLTTELGDPASNNGATDGEEGEAALRASDGEPKLDIAPLGLAALIEP